MWRASRPRQRAGADLKEPGEPGAAFLIGLCRREDLGLTAEVPVDEKGTELAAPDRPPAPTAPGDAAAAAAAVRAAAALPRALPPERPLCSGVWSLLWAGRGGGESAHSCFLCSSCPSVPSVLSFDDRAGPSPPVGAYQSLRVHTW